MVIVVIPPNIPSILDIRRPRRVCTLPGMPNLWDPERSEAVEQAMKKWQFTQEFQGYDDRHLQWIIGSTKANHRAPEWWLVTAEIARLELAWRHGEDTPFR